MFTNFCFSENILVASANRFKVLKIFICLKVTVYIHRTVDYGLKKPQMSRVSNGNLIVLNWQRQNIHMISNITQRERQRQRLRQRQRQGQRDRNRETETERDRQRQREREAETDRETERQRQRQRAKPGQAVYFKFSRCVFRILSNI